MASDIFSIIYIPIAILILWIVLKKETTKWKVIGEFLPVLVLVVLGSIEMIEGRANILLIIGLAFASIALATIIFKMIKVFLK